MIGARNPATISMPKAVSSEPTMLVTFGWMFLLALHFPLALVMHKTPLVASAHAGLILVALLIIAVSRVDPATVLMGAFYLMGSEILWRMCGAGVPWEVGKYAAAMLFGLNALRSPGRRPFWPILFLVLLLPSTVGVLFEYPFSEARRLISFNLSGHIALASCLWWSHGSQLPFSAIYRIFLTALMPLTGIMAITLVSTYSQKIVFTTEANFATSGGFGPNQVSALLGFGATICFCLLAFGSLKKRVMFIFMPVLLVVFVVQSMMTFSRTGVYLAAGFVIAAGFLLFRTPRARIYLLIGAIILGTIGWYGILPRLIDYTGGKLAERFAETDTSNRAEIMQEEFEVFWENPILGVGPGGAKSARRDLTGFASHSEPSRMLAEHGLFGLSALTLLTWQTIKAFRRNRLLFAKAYAAGAIVWVVGFLLASAMRLVAPAVVLGLIFMEWNDTSGQMKKASVKPITKPI